MRDLIYIFIGPGALVGKTYLALKWGVKTKLIAGSTGDVVLDAYLEENPGLTRAGVLKNKEKHRAKLVLKGNEMCAKDLSCLAEALINNGCRIIDGIRRKEELEVIKEKYNCLVFWVIRDGYPKTKDNTTVTRDMADFVIYNKEEK